MRKTTKNEVMENTEMEVKEETKKATTKKTATKTTGRRKKLTDEDVANIKKEIEEDSVTIQSSLLTEDGAVGEVNLNDILSKETMRRLNKDMAAVLQNGEVGREQMREVYSLFSKVQQDRIKTSNRLCAMLKMDKEAGIIKNHYVQEYALKNNSILEGELRMYLEMAVKTTKVGQWLTSIKGIGGTLAAALIANLDINKAKCAGSFISYSGLNDYNKPRYKREEAIEIVTRHMAQNPGSNPKDITDEAIIAIAEETGRNVRFLLTNGVVSKTIKCGKTTEEVFVRDKEKLISALMVIPYSQEMKKICYMISDQFIKVMNRGSLYGQLYLERKAYEDAKNENGDYADQAAAILKRKNFSKSTEAYKAYSQGKLPKAHINMRCRRFAMRIFLSHLFDAMYIDKYKRPAIKPYVMLYLEHKDVIEPEVPYAAVGIVPDEGSTPDENMMKIHDIRDSYPTIFAEDSSYTVDQLLSEVNDTIELDTDESTYDDEY